MESVVRGENAEKLPNPRLITAIYFSLLAILVTIFIDCVLYVLGIDILLPLYQSILLAVVIAGLFGALFGRLIVCSIENHYQPPFWWAFLMVLIAVPFYNLGFLWLLHLHNPSIFIDAPVKHVFLFYLFTLIYSYVLAGFWMAILAGVAGIYLRAYLVNYLKRNLYVKRHKRRV